MKGLSITALAVAVVFTATAGVAQIFRSWSVADAQRAAGQQLFNEHCMICHAPPAGAPAFGPPLAGVIGRPAGSYPGFPYSDALKKSGIVWTEDNLRQWIGDNAKLVPGTRMAHVSLSDPAEQIFVVAYLKTLTKPPAPAH
ncbi:MAG TPA: c-type cytochrome [Terriglobales bacterium]|nr:c-type cytochrome [Terriglobales bacterium]